MENERTENERTENERTENERTENERTENESLGNEKIRQDKGENVGGERKFRKLEELNLIDDFMMNQMVSHPLYGEEFSASMLQIILQKKIGRIKVTAQQAYLGEDTELHGIRIDVSIDEEGGAIYDVEPDEDRHRDHREALPRRARFYHAKIDAGTLTSGMDYGSLRNVYVIFITPYDPFGEDFTVYTVSNRCEEMPELSYDDGMKTLFLYTRGKKGNCSEALRKYVKKDRKVGVAYMKVCELKNEWKRVGREEAEAEIHQKDEVIKEQDEVIKEQSEALQKKDAEIARLRELLRLQSF